MSARAKERHLKRTLGLALDLVDALIHYDEMLYSGKKVGERPDTMQV